jgi:BTB/POZ domain-containing protein 3/6
MVARASSGRYIELQITEPILSFCSSCWEVVDAQAEMSLQSDGFADIDYATLQSVLSRNTLNCREVVIFDAALSWATSACLRQKERPTPEKLREALGDALFLIRIPAMTLEEFANGAAQSGILTLQEINDIFLHFTAVNKPVVRFDSEPRAGLQSQVSDFLLFFLHYLFSNFLGVIEIQRSLSELLR